MQVSRCALSVWQLTVPFTVIMLASAKILWTVNLAMLYGARRLDLFPALLTTRNPDTGAGVALDKNLRRTGNRCWESAFRSASPKPEPKEAKESTSSWSSFVASATIGVVWSVPAVVSGGPGGAGT